ncbi:hypothetical protein BD560DRAFT_486254 [Blakeslea trispora]|nr:hypothetical protein BD560DRAFT_486254 [Blakeslea trispora]
MARLSCLGGRAFWVQTVECAFQSVKQVRKSSERSARTILLENMSFIDSSNSVPLTKYSSLSNRIAYYRRSSPQTQQPRLYDLAAEIEQQCLPKANCGSCGLSLRGVIMTKQKRIQHNEMGIFKRTSILINHVSEKGNLLSFIG